MNFDDTARIFRLTEKPSPQLVTACSPRGVSRGQFNCLLCDIPMVWGPAMQVTNGRLVKVRDRDGRAFEQWNCPLRILLQAARCGNDSEAVSG
jgi:hypothetical protein